MKGVIEMNKRLKKKLSKGTQPNITRNMMVEALDVVIRYAEQMGFVTEGEGAFRGMNINQFNCDSANISDIEVTTTCSDLDQVLEPIISYKRRK
jgi:hypothetical protein